MPRMAVKIARQRGHMTDADIAAFKAAGYSDAELVELVLQVASATLASYGTR